MEDSLCGSHASSCHATERSQREGRHAHRQVRGRFSTGDTGLARVVCGFFDVVRGKGGGVGSGHVDQYIAV